MNFLARVGLVKQRKCYGDLPDDVIRVVASYLDRETLLSLMATSREMRTRIHSFGLPIPCRIILQLSVSTRQRDLRLCLRDEPAVCRVRAKTSCESIDMLFTERTVVSLRSSLIGLVGTPKHFPPTLETILEKIMRFSKMDLENVRFLCDNKPFGFKLREKNFDRRNILLILDSSYRNN